MVSQRLAMDISRRSFMVSGCASDHDTQRLAEFTNQRIHDERLQVFPVLDSVGEDGFAGIFNLPASGQASGQARHADAGDFFQ